MCMKQNVYQIAYQRIKLGRNQPPEMVLADLIEELDKVEALDQDTSFQLKLALMHLDQETLS